MILGLTAMAVIISIYDIGFDKVVATGTIFLIIAALIVTRIFFSKTSKKKD